MGFEHVLVMRDFQIKDDVTLEQIEHALAPLTDYLGKPNGLLDVSWDFEDGLLNWDSNGEVRHAFPEFVEEVVKRLSPLVKTGQRMVLYDDSTGDRDEVETEYMVGTPEMIQEFKMEIARLNAVEALRELTGASRPQVEEALDKLIEQVRSHSSEVGVAPAGEAQDSAQSLDGNWDVLDDVWCVNTKLTIAEKRTEKGWQYSVLSEDGKVLGGVGQFDHVPGRVSLESLLVSVGKLKHMPEGFPTEYAVEIDGSNDFESNFSSEALAKRALVECCLEAPLPKHAVLFVIDSDGAHHGEQYFERDELEHLVAAHRAQEEEGISYGESRVEAEKIAIAAKGEWKLLDRSDGRSYSGEILGVTAHHVVQSLGRSAGIHLRNYLPLPLAKGQVVDISYKDGVGVSRGVEKAALER